MAGEVGPHFVGDLLEPLLLGQVELTALPDGDARQTLLALVEFVVEREY